MLLVNGALLIDVEPGLPELRARGLREPRPRTVVGVVVEPGHHDVLAGTEAVLAGGQRVRQVERQGRHVRAEVHLTERKVRCGEVCSGRASIIHFRTELWRLRG